MMPPTSPRRSPPLLPFVLFAGGFGACLYYGQQWYQLPQYSAEDIRASAELNLQMDLQRRQPGLPPLEGVELERQRSQLQQEVAAEIRSDRDHVMQRFGLGLVALVLGLGQLVMAWLMRRRIE